MVTSAPGAAATEAAVELSGAAGGPSGLGAKLGSAESVGRAEEGKVDDAAGEGVILPASTCGVNVGAGGPALNAPRK